jgi:lipopolysaccharide export LptBFGC system permease protein LptF
MSKFLFRGIFLHFSVCASALTLIFIAQFFGVFFPQMTHHPQISFSLCMELLVLQLLWSFTVSFPIAGLFGASSLYISRLRKKNNRLVRGDNPAEFSKVTTFLMPSVALGAFIFLVILALALFVLPYANSRTGQIIDTVNTGYSAPRFPKSDREMGIREKLQMANQLSIESGKADRQRKAGLLLKKAQYMIEVYKLFAIPLLGFLLPMVGAILALMLFRLRWGQRILLFLFDIFIAALAWSLLIAGESWGDRGLISPFLSMFLSPAVVAAIIAALVQRVQGILFPSETIL